MSRMKNELVINSWTRGVAASSHNGALRTDGVNLLFVQSQDWLSCKTGATIVGDYTSPGGGFRSMTTSCHVGKARGIRMSTLCTRQFLRTRSSQE
jgi:hypothetical protein